MSKASVLTRALRELRLHMCPVSPESAGMRYGCSGMEMEDGNGKWRRDDGGDGDGDGDCDGDDDGDGNSDNDSDSGGDGDVDRVMEMEIGVDMEWWR